jgi:RNA polymerase sigma-70 factor (ECF subfamily)
MFRHAVRIWRFADLAIGLKGARRDSIAKSPTRQFRMLPPESAPSAFRATRWSLVARAASPAEPAARAALEELCRLYWAPLHALACRMGLSPADAEDATQSFFADFLNHQRFAVADPHRGKLRTFLCTAFANHLRDLQRRRTTEARGGAVVHVSIDAPRADDAPPLDPADPHDPAREFDRAWALATMDAATARLETALAERGRAGTLTPYRSFLGLDAGGGENYAATAIALGLSEGAVRVNVCRLRRDFRAALFATIADTLDAPTEENIRAEVRALIDALA